MHIIVFKGLKELLNLTLASLRYKPNISENVVNKQKMLNLDFSLEEPFTFQISFREVSVS